MKTLFSNRREFLKMSVALSGAALSSAFWPRLLRADQAPNALPIFREKMGALPIEKIKLSDKLTFLSGPGGNLAVLDGKDGKFVVDTFVQPAWPRLKQTLDSISPSPVTQVIDTHWHFDHTDNNAAFRAIGARVLAHKNVPRRLSETHDIAILHVHFAPAPPEQMPTDTFSGKKTLEANGEKLHLEHVHPAHTDSDIFIFFQDENVLHCGDLVTSNGFPLIDYDSGGKMKGMIAAAEHFLSITDSQTRIIPGHGKIIDRVYLREFHDRLVTIQDRIAALKKQGKSVAETVAAKPLDDMNADWGKGFFTGDLYTEIVYHSL